MLQWLYDMFPYTVIPSAPFCDIAVGSLFKDGPDTFLLIERDACKVRIVHWNCGGEEHFD